MCFTKWKITPKMTTSFKQIIWNYINQLLLNSWGPRRPFCSAQPGDGARRCAEHIVLLSTRPTHGSSPACLLPNTGLSNHFVFSQGSRKSKSSTQMQKSLAQAALTGAVGEVLGNLRDTTNNGLCWSAASVCTGHWTAVCHRGRLIDPWVMA